MKRIVLFVTLALLANAAHGAVEVTLFAGAGSTDLRFSFFVACIQGPCPTAAEAEVDETLGAIVGVPLAPRWQLELMAGRQTGELVFNDAGFVLVEGDQAVLRPATRVDLDLTTVQAGLLRSWGSGALEPFAVVGVGGSRLESGPLPLGRELDVDRLSASLGGGLKYRWSERFGVRAEVRGFWMEGRHAPGEDFDMDASTSVLASAGLSARF